MKIIFLTLRSPYPPQRGDKIRSFHFIKHLMSRGHQVDLVCFAENEADWQYLQNLRELCSNAWMIPFPRRGAAFRSLLKLPSRSPFQNGYWYSREYAWKVRSLVESGNYDLIHAQLFRTGQYVRNYRMPKVIDLTDALALNLMRRIRLDRSPVLPLLMMEQKRVSRYEAEIAADFDAAIVTSDIDRAYLAERNPDLNLKVVPTAVDVDYFQPTERTPEHMILFTGTMGYFPNDDAALFFGNEVMPRIVRDIPDATFYIVGNNPPPKVKALEKTGCITVTGHVEDVRPYFRRASVFVCPLRSGSGIQTKNLEAMAMGVPVVTTTFGVEGIEGVPGRDLIVADTPEEIAQRVIELMSDRELSNRISRNGRLLVERIYSREFIGSKLEAIYEESLASWQDA